VTQPDPADKFVWQAGDVQEVTEEDAAALKAKRDAEQAAAAKAVRESE
jgi:hypothetical protein